MRSRAAWTAATLIGVAAAIAPPVDTAHAQPEAAATPAPSRAILHGEHDAGEAIAVSPAGVTVRTSSAEFIVGWDRIARIDGPLSADAAQYHDLATLAWRARSRLERGDAVAAEPLYEELFDQIARTSGPTALSISEGLLRCRLWRGAHARAMEAWLNWVLVAGDEGTPRQVSTDPLNRRRIWAMALLPVIDEESGLVTSLPPVWLPGPSVRALVAGATPLLADGAEGPGLARARALGDLYLHAARYEGGDRRPVPEIEAPLRSDPGVSLVHDIVRARCGDDQQRGAARGALRARLAEELSPWQEAWVRVGLGRSLLAEADSGLIMQGVVELMHLPARFGDDQPYLTGVALAESAAALSGLGDTQGAAALDAILVQRYAEHPALEWTDLARATRGAAAPSPAAAAPIPATEPSAQPDSPAQGDEPR